MLDTLHINNFTAFSDAYFEFSPGLNVIIGENGTGKSHLLYLGYAALSVLHKAWRDDAHTAQPKAAWQRALADKLTAVFRTDVGRLCRRQQKCCCSLVLSGLGPANTAFSFVVTAVDTVNIVESPDVLTPPSKSNVTCAKTNLLQQKPLEPIPLPLFFPITEVLSFYHSSMKKEPEWAFYAIYEDLCQALTGAPLTERSQELADLGVNLEEILQGSVSVESDHFYLQHTEHGLMEISLVPEGLRKIAMLAYLLKNGGLARGCTLFWDEPEVGLNAKLQVKLVDALVALVNAGVQIVLATHDLFLMKELSLRVDAGETEARFFELLAEKPGTRVVHGNNLDDLFTITALEATLEQDDREQEIFYRTLEQVGA